jgi:uncharacterized protein (TIGR03663 family)
MLYDRTFHPDEANQAFTTGRLLETGRYTYQPQDHHGPTLYYAAAAIQKAAGHNDTASLDGTLLRSTPLVFAVLGLVLGIFTLKRLTKSFIPGLAFALLLGTSPFFAFFATDFIQEMLLACFLLMIFWAGVGYLNPGTKWKTGTWALFFGTGAGLAFATKETCLISFTAAALAATPFLVKRLTLEKLRARARDAVLAVLGFLIITSILYSDFGRDFHGVYNAFIAAPLSYLGRAAGDASASTGANWHVHPWWQYFLWLFSGHLSLANFICLGLSFGIFAIPVGRATRATFLFMTAYALLLLAFYSAIPYKTPWCALQILVPLLLASFLGCINFCEAIHSIALRKYNSLPPKAIHILSYAPLLYLAAHMLYGNSSALVRMNRDPDSTANPCNYAAASPEVKELAATVASAMASATNHQPQTTNHQSRTTNHESPFIAVALPAADTWPFPWYNRPYERQTGYWTSFDDLKALADAGIKPTVVIVLMEEGHLVQPLFPHLKHTKRFYMRPRIPERKVRGARVRVFW